MDLCGGHILKPIITYLKIDESELTKLIERKNSILPEETCGIIWIITLLAKQKMPSLCGQNNIEEAFIRQWLEYITIKCLHSHEIDLKFLEDLNDILSDRVYFVACKLSLADVVLYYVLQPVLEKFNKRQKGNYVHVCRWFDHIQQDPEIRQDNNLIVFPRNCGK